MVRPLYVWLTILFFLVAFVGIIFLIFDGKKVETIVVPTPIATETSPEKYSVIGKSVEGRKIEAYTFGTGKKHLVFIGGVHGGYELNSVVLAYRLLDHIKENPDIISKNITLTIIPSANPDGVFAVIKKEGRYIGVVPTGKDTEKGRFNANKVDLNRNFDCKWQPKSVWRSYEVSAGSRPFSEPESVAIRDFVLANKPSAVIFWHSQSGSVYASECRSGILPQTLSIMNLYARASGYKPNETFDAYETTGDADSWLAKIGIPSITVELTTHEDVEWESNLSGVKALLKYYEGDRL